jgi:hypothetical protein
LEERVEGARRSYMCRAPESVARRRDCGDKACRRVGWSGSEVLEAGMRILEVTRPVDEEKAFRRESVPAE